MEMSFRHVVQYSLHSRIVPRHVPSTTRNQVLSLEREYELIEFGAWVHFNYKGIAGILKLPENRRKA